MFFYLSKILDFLLNPITWVFILLVWGFISKRPKRKKGLILSGIVVLYIFSNGFIFSEVMRVLERDPVNVQGKNYKYGVVLGGMVGYTEANRPAFYRSSDRFLQALSLYADGTIEKIILSGGSGRLVDETRMEADLLKDYLVSIGFNEEDILVENQSRNTRENALYTALLLERLNVDYDKNPVLLISSAYHIPRAEACFRKAGVEPDVFPVDHYAAQTRRFHPDHLLLPDSEILFQWEIIIHELVGMVMYKVAGYA